ncbi:cysteine hydrolase [Pseudolysinimonas kribbensis]|uniref:Isochorismatase n=1 Tax=Pseudolysinimonas kribbensis TaxID=433641 RepID=A0ABQ6K3P6_9MICO|nr:isochorismatase family cysteine hydrolase [Pseudolysinimonas kribbensis]GMA93482.1 isochorismatase [Pseudolysinimonas kribbensis]
MNPIDPARTALLLMDLQPSVLARYPADVVLPNAIALRDAARDAGVLVGYVHVALAPEEAAAVPATNPMFSGLAARMAGADPAMSEVDPRLEIDVEEPVFRKTRVGAFSTTDLDARLRERDIDTLVLAGISTSGVVLSTVRDGADRDYRLIVVADACSDLDDEVHRVLTQKVFPRQAEVVTTAEAVEVLGADA